MEKIVAYKGFDKDLKCRDFQYEIGGEYEMDGDVKACERGFTPAKLRWMCLPIMLLREVGFALSSSPGN